MDRTTHNTVLHSNQPTNQPINQSGRSGGTEPGSARIRVIAGGRVASGVSGMGRRCSCTGGSTVTAGFALGGTVTAVAPIPTGDEPEYPGLTAPPPDGALTWELSECLDSERPLGLERHRPLTCPPFGHRLEVHRRRPDGDTEVGHHVRTALERWNPELATNSVALDACVRLVEAGVVDVDAAVAGLTTPGRERTDEGDLVIANLHLYTAILLPHPRNDRTLAYFTVRRSRPARELGDVGGLPTVQVDDAEAMVRILNDQYEALGFRLHQAVRDPKDRYHLEWIQAAGVLEPALVAFHRLIDRSTGAEAIGMHPDDANRRLGMEMWSLAETLPRVPWRELGRLHWDDGAGRLALRHLGVEDVDRFRSWLSADPQYWPATAHPDAVRAWGDGADRRVAVHARTRVIPVRLVLGVDRASLPKGAAPSQTLALASFRDRQHQPLKRQVDWTGMASQLSVVQRALLAVQRSVAAGRLNWFDGDMVEAVVHAPETFTWDEQTVRGVRTVADLMAAGGVAPADLELTDEVPLSALGDLPPALVDHPALGDHGASTSQLRVMAALVALFVARGHALSIDINTALRTGSATVSPLARSKALSEQLAALAQLSPPIDDRAAASAGRTWAHSAFYKLGEHIDPLSAIDPEQRPLVWPDLLREPWDRVYLRALREHVAWDQNPSLRPLADTGRFGPAQRLLAVAGGLALQFAPPAAAPRSLSHLTVTGMGFRRGHTSAEPHAVLLRLLEDAEGLTQLYEVICAAVDRDGPRNARSVRHDPERYREEVSTRGQEAIDRYGAMWGLQVTEYCLRGDPWGWRKPGGADPGTAPGSATGSATGQSAAGGPSGLGTAGPYASGTATPPSDLPISPEEQVERALRVARDYLGRAWDTLAPLHSDDDPDGDPDTNSDSDGDDPDAVRTMAEAWEQRGLDKVESEALTAPASQITQFASDGRAIWRRLRSSRRRA
jgi:hypothetical protein